MKTAREAFERLRRTVNVKYYLGAHGAKLIEDACCTLTEEEKGRPPSYVAPKEEAKPLLKPAEHEWKTEELPTEAEVDEALFED